MGKLTDEHVWPHWLRSEVAAAQRLIDSGCPSERMPHYEPVITVDDEGVFHHELEKHKDLDVLLPMVTVPICSSCNNAWLNAKEIAVQPLLRPFLRGEADLRLAKHDFPLLATWALKTFMNYGLTRGSQTNPFSPQEYRQLRSSGSVPANVRIWMFTSSSRWAQGSIPAIRGGVTLPPGAHGHHVADQLLLGLGQAGIAGRRLENDVGVGLAGGSEGDPAHRALADVETHLEAHQVAPEPQRGLGIDVGEERGMNGEVHVPHATKPTTDALLDS